MSERADIARLERLLARRRLMFVEVGSHAHKDRVVPVLVEKNGATVRSAEYLALLREIVHVVRKGRP